jgi:hypothetical protein
VREICKERRERESERERASERERERERDSDGEGQREREGESGEKWNGGRTERGQELMGSHLIIVAVKVPRPRSCKRHAQESLYDLAVCDAHSV